MFKNKFKGKFIAIEGLDGSGSTTQTEKIRYYLKNQNKNTWTTQEPTNNIIGGIIKSCLTGDWKVPGAIGLQLLFASDRASHLKKDIIPRLEKGVNVITDRYFLSSIAYGSLEINDADWLYKINDQFILPDLTILIKTSTKTSLKRIKDQKAGLELFENESKLEKVWENYEKISKKYPNIKIIDGEKEENEVFEEIKNEVNKIIK